MSISKGAVPNLSAQGHGENSCEIMGPAGTLIQLALGVFSFLVLSYKRTMENPKREIQVWALDTSKQAISGGVAHILNVVSALLMTSHEEDTTADSCAWYFVNMLFDTAIGSIFNIALLLLLERFFTKHNLEYLKSGNYFTEKNTQEDTFEANRGDGHQIVHIKHVYVDINYLAWTLQLLIWCGIVSIVKVGLFFIQLQLSSSLGEFGAAVLATFRLKGLMRLIFSLVIVPTILNSIQFWITDNFLKKKTFNDKEQAAKSLYFQPKSKSKKHLLHSKTGTGKQRQSLVVQIPAEPIRSIKQIPSSKQAISIKQIDPKPQDYKPPQVYYFSAVDENKAGTRRTRSF